MQQLYYIKARNAFLEILKDSINPDITTEDVKEMMIQHILTADIFNTIFDEVQFHRENNIAKELENVLATFFTGTVRRATLESIKHYYQTIKANASGIADHHEKQRFLKVIYETFYKSYNPKAADRLGVVYTPNEIVRFMITGIDHLLYEHFNKYLHDEGVEILDVATGTGTFVCDLIDYIKKDKLEYKYKNEIHANEVAILPYYISNLNIEFTYTQKTGKYAEFENLCFVDTLDNMGFGYRGKQIDMFAPFTEENSKRIKKQNDKKIAVIIGNPPYNANQVNENDNNKNREYPEIDKRIKDTFIKNSTAQKTKLYDMYARFFRWSMDRLTDRGIICFISNNSYINSRTFDGFRKSVQDEFQYAYIIDLGGNIRELSGKDGIFLNEKNTIFGEAAAVGISIIFLIKDSKAEHKQCSINYIHPTDIRATRDEKFEYLRSNSIQNIPFIHITPDKNNNWVQIVENDFSTLIPLIDKKAKAGKNVKSLFKMYSNGVKTNRDEWVYDFNSSELKKKVEYFINSYNLQLKSGKHENDELDYSIKWSRDLKNKLYSGKSISFSEKKVILSLARPFVKQYFYSEKILNDVLTNNHYEIFGSNLKQENKVICFVAGSRLQFSINASDIIPNYAMYSLDPIQFYSLFCYNEQGEKVDNLTDWGLNQFIKAYKNSKITKEEIFNYTYGVFHNPEYTKKYELNLKREFPRIPFYKDFKKWSDIGKKLMDLHINFESVIPYSLNEITNKEVKNPKCKLKTDKENGIIILDEASTLSGIPAEAWNYKLGNRSALEWVLDQYKEKKSTDPTIMEKFNTYKFSEYKEQVIDLLKRVCTVSVETMKIIEQMKNEK